LSLLEIATMRFTTSPACLLFLLCAQALAAPGPVLKKRDLNAFVASQKAFSVKGALNNIGPNGALVPGAGAGFVVASPSKVNPNCK
jgi:glucoamylase